MLTRKLETTAVAFISNRTVKNEVNMVITFSANYINTLCLALYVTWIVENKLYTFLLNSPRWCPTRASVGALFSNFAIMFAIGIADRGRTKNLHNGSCVQSPFLETVFDSGFLNAYNFTFLLAFMQFQFKPHAKYCKKFCNGLRYILSLWLLRYLDVFLAL